MHYRVRVQNDMGHLSPLPNDSKGLPDHVKNIVFQKMNMYTESHLFSNPKAGTTFMGQGYRMKPGYQKRWTYDCGGGDRVVIEFLI